MLVRCNPAAIEAIVIELRVFLPVVVVLGQPGQLDERLVAGVVEGECEVVLFTRTNGHNRRRPYPRHLVLRDKEEFICDQ